MPQMTAHATVRTHKGVYRKGARAPKPGNYNEDKYIRGKGVVTLNSTKSDQGGLPNISGTKRNSAVKGDVTSEGSKSTDDCPKNQYKCNGTGTFSGEFVCCESENQCVQDREGSPMCSLWS